MLNKMKLMSLLLLGSVFMVACGQKGPLYKTPEVQDNQTEQTTPKSEVPTTTSAVKE